ncbi:MAG: TetR/AcrR family transcriptional regulator [Candidatus Dormibacteraeota bacterium]|uniref:TetR/AcrR family transcriptional regulator n=2 Tax=Candidatus Nephthysia bennettiae TaxID=3127016 RepID=A0A934KDG2_9BACT|nr:TetR/AcrR family transcriptional regulator [Candidatus Dormibacteraeota bacterium]
MVKAAPVERRNRLGRPRNRPIGPHAQPREEILDAAATLFETHGFGATTTRQIAAAAGLEQGSIFHYFTRKDELLAELLDRTLEPALAYAGWLDRQPIPIDQKLYLLAYRDTINICSGPHNLAMLMHLPEAKRPEFKSYWQKRLALKRTYRRYILAGLRNQTFNGVRAGLGSELVFAMVESTIEWFDRSRDNAARAADRVATAVLRLLLSDSLRIGEIVRLASPRLTQAPQPGSADLRLTPPPGA